MGSLQKKAIELTNKFPEIKGNRREELAASFSEALDWERPHPSLTSNHQSQTAIIKPSVLKRLGLVGKSFMIRVIPNKGGIAIERCP
jgi:hypothetical protein